jgi:hypothetical protein
MLDTGIVHENSLHMNTLSAVLAKVLKIVEKRFPTRFQQRPVIRRRFEQQLEFPWLAKR